MTGKIDENQGCFFEKINKIEISSILAFTNTQKTPSAKSAIITPFYKGENKARRSYMIYPRPHN